MRLFNFMKWFNFFQGNYEIVDNNQGTPGQFERPSTVNCVHGHVRDLRDIIGEGCFIDKII